MVNTGYTFIKPGMRNSLELPTANMLHNLNYTSHTVTMDCTYTQANTGSDKMLPHISLNQNAHKSEFDEMFLFPIKSIK
jgi:hypothetical protein